MPAPTLVTIRPGVSFTPEAAASWLRMEKKVGRRISTNSTYRDWDAQYKLWLHWVQTGKPPRALHPDNSMHCKGLAADTNEVTLLKSLRDYGWRQTAPDEDWHFEYKRNEDKHYGEPTGGGSKPLPIPKPPTPKPPVVPQEEEEMNPIYYRLNKKAIYALDTVTGESRLLDIDEWKIVNAVYAAIKKPVPFSDVVL